eukprot:GHVU01174023.1.p1 GENE.GHVU01174023.1~~GHVU01174023.1.p1  ORF type:complete len:758 (+),score=71.84 GHVU01174023.1:80-2353(+)
MSTRLILVAASLTATGLLLVLVSTLLSGQNIYDDTTFREASLLADLDMRSHLRNPGAKKFEKALPEVDLPSIANATFGRVEASKYSQFGRQVDNGIPTPKSRAFVVYVPQKVPYNHYLDELYAFTESWRFVFNILETKDDVHVTNSRIKRKNKDGGPSMHRKADPSEYHEHGSEMEQIIPVNDLVVVADYEIDSSSFPDICTLVRNEIPPSAERVLDLERRVAEKRSRCFILQTPISATQFNPIWKSHQAMHSVSCLTEPFVEAYLMQYDLMMRSDLDCYLSPGQNIRGYLPWRPWFTTRHLTGSSSANLFFVGQGGYGHSISENVLRYYSKLLGLRDQGITAIGSAWFGSPSDLLNVAKLTVAVGEFLLRFDPVFARGDGEWPKWFKGVTLLYSGHLAVNHLIDKERVLVLHDQIDQGPTAGRKESVMQTKILHFHNWHTDQFFSKFWFMNHRYNMSILNDWGYEIVSAASETYQRVEPSGRDNKKLEMMPVYAFINAWNGKEREEKELERRKTKDVRTKFGFDYMGTGNNRKIQLPEGISGLFKHLFFCPPTHPHAFVQLGEYETEGLVEGDPKVDDVAVRCCKFNDQCSRRTEGSLKNCCDDPDGTMSVPCHSKVCMSHPVGRGGIATKRFSDYIRAATEMAQMGEMTTGSPGPCPGSHPFPYESGSFCCARPYDCNNWILDSRSSCCYHNRHVPCKRKPCSNLDPQVSELRKIVEGDFDILTRNINMGELLHHADEFKWRQNIQPSQPGYDAA